VSLEAVRRRRHRLLLVALALAVLALVIDRAPDWYFDPRPGNPAKHVLVYTTSWCPVCDRLRACLGKHGVPFEERDVERSWRWDREWSAAGGIGVPLTLVGNEVAHGLRQTELEPLLAHAASWPAEQPPPLGTVAEVKARLAEVFPGINWRAPNFRMATWDAYEVNPAR
jgi:glutaredoxin